MQVHVWNFVFVECILQFVYVVVFVYFKVYFGEIISVTEG